MEAVHREVFYKVGVFRNFAKFKQKHLPQSALFDKVVEASFKKETSVHMFKLFWWKKLSIQDIHLDQYVLKTP